MQAIDITGKTFGRLTVIKEILPRTRPRLWECKCSCGVIKNISQESLTKGKTTSCGCYRKEVASNKSKDHGKSNTPLHRVWKGMRQRCLNKNNPSYHYYGGRGITICNEWLTSFESFYNWAITNNYKEKLTLDRIDPNQGYKPDNCRFVDFTTQARNRRIKNTNNTGYTGVCYSNNMNKYVSYIGIDNKQIVIGYYCTIEEAAEARETFIKINNLENYYKEN